MYTIGDSGNRATSVIGSTAADHYDIEDFHDDGSTVGFRCSAEAELAQNVGRFPNLQPDWRRRSDRSFLISWCSRHTLE